MRKAGPALVMPSWVIVGFVLLIPTVVSIMLSFTAYRPGTSIKWAGLTHYIALFKDAEYRTSLFNTFIFTFITVPLELFFGLLLALLLNRVFRGRGLIRLAALFPWAIPTALNALIWRWMYNADYGLFNAVLLQIGVIRTPIVWLGTIPLAMVAMMLVAVWKTSSFMSLILLAGLQAIPRELYEAAYIDGAGGWSAFWNITLPHLWGSIFVALLLRSMDAFRAFGLPFNLTRGGPLNSTETLSVYAYKQTFQFVNFGYGSSIAVTQFIFLLLLALVYLSLLKKREQSL